MTNFVRSFLAGIAALVVTNWSRHAWAGMPSVGFTEVARLRLDAISFFLAGFLLSSAIMLCIWNYLRRDFTWLPKLNYRRACLVVAVWGFLFVIVLTMISGARELMTPGAWRKQWYTYELVEGEYAAEEARERKQRRERAGALERLGQALTAYAAAHEGAYPPANDPSIAPELWRSPFMEGLKYVYRPGLKVTDGEKPLAYEPSADGGSVWVLTAAGNVVVRDFDDVVRSAPSKD